MKTTPYARFFKCDLQLQTPADSENWDGERLAVDATGDEWRASADAFIARCHEVRLEVIAVTDHNLAGARGLRYFNELIEAERRYAEKHHRHLTIFPGFEVAAAPGRVHFLCLFEPGTAISEVSGVLGELGLPEHDRNGSKPSNKSVEDLLHCVQEVRHGIVIAAHADRGSGACDDRSLSEVWQQDLVLNPSLLALEFTKPRSYWNKGKLGDIAHNRGGWRRAHPIAVVNSSDNKRISPGDGEGGGTGKPIGARHTWIKMSKPSIEGLRQAFLDHESRITFGDQRPEDLFTHPRIERITVNGVDFLDGVTFDLPPGLTTLIGGGGTGKSTIIEAIRGATAHPPKGRAETQTLHDRAVQSLGDGRVTLDCRVGSDLIHITLDHGQSETQSAQFPVLALSQREAFAIASDSASVLGLIDEFGHDRLEMLARLEQDAAADVEQIVGELQRLPALRQRKKQLEAEVERYDAELRAAEGRAAPLAARNQHRREAAVVQSVDQRLERLAAELEDVGASMVLGIARSSVHDPDTPHADAVAAYIERAGQRIDDVAAQVAQLAAHTREYLASERARPERAVWSSELQAAEDAYNQVQLQVGDFDPSELADAISQRRNAISAAEDEIADLTTRSSAQSAAIEELRAIWRQQLRTREKVADQLGTALSSAQTGSPYMSVNITGFADATPLIEELCNAVDGRSLTDEQVRELCEVAWADLDDRSAAGQALVDLLDRIIEGGAPEGLALGARVPEMLAQRVTTAVRARLLTIRPSDRISVEVFQSDGKRIGTLESARDGAPSQLSVGQRCAAVIAMVLAYGNEPVIIDQPEDEIDNEFISSELVPLIRAAKTRRQVIVATHNPNIPVNGDAELIVALTATGGAGGVQSAIRSSGSLDSKAVQGAVEVIMEGSRDAFEQRRRRYGF